MAKKRPQEQATPVEWEVVSLVLRLIIFGGILIGIILVLGIGSFIWLLVQLLSLIL